MEPPQEVTSLTSKGPKKYRALVKLATGILYINKGLPGAGKSTALHYIISKMRVNS